MNKSFLKALALSFFIVITNSSIAEQTRENHHYVDTHAADASHTTHSTIETVTVIGQRLPATIANVQRSELSPGKEAGESLRDLLGVSGSRMGGHGLDPSIRGLSQTQLNVLIDGAYIHGGCPNRMDPPSAYANGTAFDEVTVIRGTQTLAYGAGGPGGTILFKRSAPTFEPGTRISGEFASSWRHNGDSGSLSVDLALGEENRFLRLMGSATDSGNYQDGDGNTLRSSYKENTAGLVSGFRTQAGQWFEISYDYQETKDALYPGAGMDAPKAEGHTVKLRSEWAEWGRLSNTSLEIYRSDVEHVMDNFSLRQSPMPDLAALSSSVTVGGRLNTALDSTLGLWKLGVDMQQNSRRAHRLSYMNHTTTVNSYLWPDVTVRQIGAYAELGHFLSPTLWMLAGARIDHLSAKADDIASDPPGMPLSPESLYTLYYTNAPASRSDTAAAGLLRFEYAPQSKTNDAARRYYFALSRTVRSPDASERFLAANGMTPSARWVGNPNLKPEQHHQIEAGWTFTGPKLELQAAVYLNRVSDYVLRDRFVEGANNASIYRNVSAQLWGGELQSSWHLTDAMRVDLGAAYVKGSNRTDHRALPQIPPLEGYAALHVGSEGLFAHAEIRAATRQDRVDTRSSTGVEGQGLDVRATPGWSTINMHVGLQVSTQLRVSAGIDNLLDRSYAQHLNRGNAFDPQQIQVNEPGRTVWLSVNAEL